ncbi:hypothetical protein LTR37_011557 [Vermiconidia calcicola]|uniref:Uncharacterized protein n=1 Tax=Vermiconidia calcicola TaxID=1690605 RepID=A0ACC3N2B0_9PEZI|nr:hypothetical protein LTR37_011557 [Vermiconidia calcicola]
MPLRERGVLPLVNDFDSNMPLATGLWGGTKRYCSERITTSTSYLVSRQTTVVTDLFEAYDWPIAVMWAESDLDKFIPASAPVLPAMVAFTGAAITSPAVQDVHSTTSSLAPSTTKSEARISTGAQAGIGIGVAVPATGLLAGIGYLLYRRRKRQRTRAAAKTEATPTYSYPSSASPKAELQSHEYRELGVPGSDDYGGGILYHEMRGQSNQWELEARELPANQPYHVSR